MRQAEEAKRAFARKFGCEGRSVSDRDDLLFAVRLAYQGATPRTIKGHGAIPPEEIAQLCERLADQLGLYLDGTAPETAEEFDGAHGALCAGFLADYNDLLERHGLPAQAYGKVQKIVNMALKYLYCFDDAASRDAWFAHCHMPIDSIISEWWKDEGVTSCTITWTRLSEDEYRFFAGLARNWCKDHPLTEGNEANARPLDLELVAWNRARGIQAPATERKKETWKRQREGRGGACARS